MLRPHGAVSVRPKALLQDGTDQERRWFTLQPQYPWPYELVVMIDVATLPDGWDNYVPIPETKDIGTDWYDGGSSIGLMVPSVIVPIECNVLINNHHTEFKACQKTVQLMDIPFDRRLLKKAR